MVLVGLTGDRRIGRLVVLLPDLAAAVALTEAVSSLIARRFMDRPATRGGALLHFARSSLSIGVGPPTA